MGTINEIQVDAIRHRVEHGVATSQDCADLLEYMNEAVDTEEMSDKIVGAVCTAVESAIESSISQSTIVRNCQIAIASLKAR